MTGRFIVRGLLGLALLTSSSMVASAQVPGTASLPQATITAFLANPGGLLAERGNANGGPRLTKEVQDLVTSDPSTLNAIIALLKDANPAQQKAIAEGLKGAAQAYAKTNPGEATTIQQAVAATGMPSVVADYAAASGDVATGATGGGGGGGGGGSGSGGPTGGTTATGGGGGGLPLPAVTSTTTTSSGLTGASVSGGGIVSVSSH
jgi:hypothetical protein